MTEDLVPSDLAAARIQAVRQSRGWSAKDLALRCAELGATQLTASVIHNIESGRRNASGRRRREVSVDELLALAQALELPPFELIQIPADQKTVSVEITGGVRASRDELASWLRGLSASIPLLPPDGFLLCGSCGTLLSSRYEPDYYYYYYYCPNRSCRSPVRRCPLEMVLTVMREFIVSIAEDVDAIPIDRGTGKSLELLESRFIALYDEIYHLEERRADAIRDLKDLAEHPELDAKVVATAISSFDKSINVHQQELTQTRHLLWAKRHGYSLPAIVGLLENWDHSSGRDMHDMARTVIREIRVWPDPITSGVRIQLVPLWEQREGL